MRSLYRPAFGCLLMFAGSQFFLVGATRFAAAQLAPQPKAIQHAASQPAATHPAASHAGVTPVGKVSRVTVSGGSGGLEVEITTSRPVVLRSQVVPAPDRLILDFPDALPGSELRDQTINRGQVKGIRVGLFSEHPPVTRVVIDLKSAQPYRIYPSGKTVVVRLATGEQPAVAGSSAPAVPVKPPPVLQVQYSAGRLSILAHDVSLAQVLHEIQSKTGADIPIPSVASQEQIVTNIGPLPIREALAALLNGSRFNFVMVGADDDPSRLKSVILTFRSGSGASQPAIASQSYSPPTPAPVPQPVVVETGPEPEPVLPSQMDPPPDAQPQPQPQPQEGPGQQEAPPPQDNVPPPQ